MFGLAETVTTTKFTNAITRSNKVTEDSFAMRAQKALTDSPSSHFYLHLYYTATL